MSGEWRMAGRTVTTDDLARILPGMIEDETDPAQRARLEQTLLLVGYADKLRLTGVPWAEAKQAAFDRFPPLTDEELKQARRAPFQMRPSSSAFFAANSSSVRAPWSRSAASFAICSVTSGCAPGAIPASYAQAVSIMPGRGIRCIGRGSRQGQQSRSGGP